MINKLSTSQQFKDSPIDKIPVDWEVRTLKDCCLIKGEYGINAAAVEYSEELPTYIRITDIDDDGNYNGLKKVSVNDENSGNFLLQAGDIVFARTGATVGKTYLYDSKDGVLVFAGFLIRFRTNEKFLIPQHLKHFTSTNQYWNWVKTVSMRSGQPGINAEEYGSIKILLPPLPEQKTIAHVLGLMDSAINTNNRLIAQKELQKKWLMQNLLTGKRRLKKFNGEWNKLGAEEIFKSVSIKGSENEELLSATQDKGIIPRSMLEGRVTMPTNGTESYKLVEPGDFVVSLRSFQGGLEYSYYKGIVSPAYTILKTKKKIDDEFYKQYFKSNDFIGHLAIAVIGIRDGKQISYDDFCTVRIPYPSLDEQTAIAKVLQTADKEIQQLKAKTEKLREQKKGLMQMLLTGKRRLNLLNTNT